ncbi:MAG: prenyltransferase/squalene oxidase repeat-containing protein [Phycisphaeraceae bacterium]
MQLDGLDLEAFEETRRNAIALLLKERNEQGWWTGELSSSALSTATAIVAMTLATRNGCNAANSEAVQPLIDRGYDWLIANQNADGGWGDTDKSKSNISTTMLVWGAMGLGAPSRQGGAIGSRSPVAIMATTDGRAATAPPCRDGALNLCENWLRAAAGSLEIPALVETVMKRYGKDRTFSVPILTMCALCGRLGPVTDRATWKWVKQLPFEFAALPRWLFKFLNLQVVSYALPALIAIGVVRHHFRPTRNPFARVARAITKKRTLRLLEQIQPPNGGFLEATPLTSFVTMSLAACGFADSLVARRGIDFLIKSARPDGSWAIDTNLATWVTTLSVNALAAGGTAKLNEYLNEGERGVIRDWLLGQQYKDVHPYTGAAPGGWAWTDLPGGVPDADDTSGAVLALANMAEWRRGDSEGDPAVIAAGDWLRSLQNRNRGIPTFCRGWGKLPFDQSCADISAHAFEAGHHASWVASPRGFTPVAPRNRFHRLMKRIAKYLVRSQNADGSWRPLWFGNQHVDDESNPVYGTSRVLATGGLFIDIGEESKVRAENWLISAQHPGGGWGGSDSSHCSIEETSLAIEALATCILCGGVFEAMRSRWTTSPDPKRRNYGEIEIPRATTVAKPQAAEGAVVRGVKWLIQHTARGTSFPPSPIGFYFAKLWYYEKLYPIIFTVAALERVAVLIEAADDAKR